MPERCLLTVIGLGFLAGCDSAPPPLTPVSGAVSQNGKPLAGGFVQFLPQGGTPGHGGMAKIDAAGHYEVLAGKMNGRKGLPPGDYKVVLTRRLMPDGSPPPPKVPPIESGARETIPEQYTKPDETPLAITIGAEAKMFDITLEGN